MRQAEGGTETSCHTFFLVEKDTNAWKSTTGQSCRRTHHSAVMAMISILSVLFLCCHHSCSAADWGKGLEKGAKVVSMQKNTPLDHKVNMSRARFRTKKRSYWVKKQAPHTKRNTLLSKIWTDIS